jgi:hypothetical protein
MATSGTAGGRIAPGVGANLIGQHAHDRNQEATTYVGNLDPQVTEELVWELFTQAGPVGERGHIISCLWSPLPPTPARPAQRPARAPQ